MSDIDPGTGLPELPEGFRWKVSTRYSSWDTSGKTEFVVILEAEFNQPYWRSADIFDWFRLKFKGEWVDSKRWDAYLTSPYFSGPLTQTAILERAERLMEVLEQKKLEEKLLGTYPPKALNGDENA